MSSAPIYEFMDLYKQLYKTIGSKIKLKLREVECEGIIQHVLPTCNRVTMDHVYVLPKRTYMGTLHFFFNEILSFTVLESAKQIGKPEKWEYVSRFPDKDTYHITDLKEDVPHPDKSIIDDFAMDLPTNLRCKLPSDNVIIATVNSDFRQAIKYISQQKTIGVAFEGPKISRSGKLSWVCISSPFCVFLFDIQRLGKAAFDKGLRQIFQNKNVEKVIHDCRHPSDCLYHLFETELVNVFDTQVADINIASMERYNKKPAFKYVSSLDSCLLNYLDVPPEYLHNRRKYFTYEDEVVFYRARPISNDYRDVLIKDVVYLCLLKDKMSKLMLNPFCKAVDICLNSLASYSAPDLVLHSSICDGTLPALLSQSLQTVPFVEVKESPIISFACKFRDILKGTVMKVNEEPTAIEQNLNVDKTLSKESLVRKSRKYSTESSRIDYQKSAITQNSVVVENMCVTNSDKHIDNMNNLPALDISENSDVKPSKDCVVAKTSVFTSTLSHNEPVNSKSGFHDDKQLKSDLGKCMSGSYETLSGYSSDASIDSPSHSSCEIWTKLRSELSPEPLNLRRNIQFVPAGM